MPSYYIYLISSLPMLQFGMRPPFSFEVFLARCRELIPEGDAKILGSVRYAGTAAAEGTLVETERRWQEFDTSLRNELARIRASHKKIDPHKYIRHDGFTSHYVAQIALAAHRQATILDAEKLLDQERWQVLDELGVGHYFDLEFLVLYGHKLLILERWERINSADKPRLLEAALG